MSEDRKMIYLYLAHMSEEGTEQKYVKEAFEQDLAEFVNGMPDQVRHDGESQVRHDSLSVA